MSSKVASSGIPSSSKRTSCLAVLILISDYTILAGLYSLGQLAGAHQVMVDVAGGVAAFGDGPDDQGLAAGHVAGGEDAGDGLKPGHQVRVEGEFRAGDGLKPGHRADARGVELFDVAMFIAGEPGGGDAPFADAALFVRAFGAELHGPEGPGGGRGALERGLRQQLELMHGEGLLAVGGAQTIGSGIAAADDDDALALGGHGRRASEELHGEVDAVQLAAGDREIAGLLGAAGEQDGVVAAAQIFDRNVAADVGIGDELDALGAHLLETPVDEVLFHLEIRDAVAEEAADAVVLFKHGDGVAGAAQLLCGGEARGAGADDGDALAGDIDGRLGRDPAFGEGAIDDRLFDLLDGDRRLVDAEYAGGFAGRGAEAAGELGKVVGGMQDADGFAPAAAVDEIVPIGNDVGERTAGVAEGHAAIHAAGALRADFFFGEIEVDFEPVVDALRCGAALGQFAGVFEEAGGFTHGRPRGDRG